jgi:hypothetical protein
MNQLLERPARFEKTLLPRLELSRPHPAGGQQAPGR